jgi:hypothetical protein
VLIIIRILIYLGLAANTTYYVRGEASNGTYTGYSNVSTQKTYQFPYVSAITTSSLIIGNQQTISLYNPLKRNITVYMKKDNTSGTQLYSGTTSNETSFSFTPTAATLYSSIPAANSANCVYYCVYSSKIVQTKSGTYKVSGGNKQAPTFSAYNYQDTGSVSAALTNKKNVNNPGVFINGLSTCKFIIPTANKATSAYGATLDHYEFKWNNAKSTHADYSSTAEITSSISNGTAGTISVIAYDKRGQYKQVDKSVTIISPSIAKASLKTIRNNGITTTVYLNGTISCWVGNWNKSGDTARPNKLQKIFYTVGSSNTEYDITSAVKNNSTNTTSNNVMTYTLKSNTIQLHQNGTSGGFPIGTEYTIKIYVSSGITDGNVTTYYDNKRLVATLIVTAGKIGMARYKDGSNEYHYGINGLPESGHNLIVTGLKEQIAAQSSVSGKTITLGIGSGGINRGIFDMTTSKWLVYYDDTKMINNADLQVNGVISSDVITNTYINGNKGIGVKINDTSEAGGFKMIARQKSSNGVFMFGTFNANFCVFYTKNETISAESNSPTKTLLLLNELGNTIFPGNVDVSRSY